MIICKKIIGIGPEIGTEQEADKRICLPVMNIGPRIGEQGITVEFGDAGLIEFGDAGVIIL